MNKKLLFSVFAIIVILLVVYFFFFNSSQQSQVSTKRINTTSTNGTQTATENGSLLPLKVPDGWVTYIDKDLGIAFSYPGNWYIAKRSNIGLKGDGAKISIGYAGTDLPQKDGAHPTYIIDGIQANTWQSDEDHEIELIIVVQNFQFWINIPDQNKSVVDRILSTVKFK